MSKIKFLSLMTIMLMVTDVASAANEPTSLATKNYVDTGLSYVYQDVSANKTAIGDSSSGLIKDVADLQSAVENFDNAAYSGTNGITIGSEKVNGYYPIGLDVNAAQGKKYIYTQSGWQELEFVSSWGN